MPYNTPFGTNQYLQYGVQPGQMGPAQPNQYGYGTSPGGPLGYYEQQTPVGSFAAANYAGRPQQQTAGYQTAGNPYIGQQSQGIAGVGNVNAPNNNPWLGQSTQQATTSSNPYAGSNNPYLTQQIDAAAGDITRNFNNVVNPQFDRMAVQSGSFGNTGVEAARGRAMSDVGRQIGDVANSMRMQDYGLQAQLGENAANRATQTSQFNSGLNAGDLTRNMAGAFQGGAQDLQAQMFNAGNQLGTQQFNAGLGSQDLARNASLSGQLGMFNAGAGNTASMFNAGQGNSMNQYLTGLDQGVNLYNTGAGNAMLENARTRNQQQGQFNDTLDYNIYRGNTADARAAMGDQMAFLSQLLGMNQGGANTATGIQNTPMNFWQQFMNGGTQAGGIGGTGSTNTPYYGNPLLGFLGGMGLFNGFGG